MVSLNSKALFKDASVLSHKYSIVSGLWPHQDCEEHGPTEHCKLILNSMRLFFDNSFSRVVSLNFTDNNFLSQGQKVGDACRMLLALTLPRVGRAELIFSSSFHSGLLEELMSLVRALLC